MSSSTHEKLTLIRVRGKRKLRHPPTAGSLPKQGNKTESRTLADAPKLRPESPSPVPNKRLRESSPAGDKSWSRSPEPRHARMHKTPPFDQCFPPEIIERIFFYSDNLNLALASPRLGVMLSSRHTLRSLVIQSFAPIWDLTQYSGHSRRKRARSNIGASLLFDLVVPHKNKILTLPWAKMDLMLEALQFWLQKKKARGKMYTHTFCPFSEHPTVATAARFVLNMRDLKTLVESHPQGHIRDFESWILKARHYRLLKYADTVNDGGELHKDLIKEAGLDSFEDETDGEAEGVSDASRVEQQNAEQVATRRTQDSKTISKKTQRTRINPTERACEASAHVCFALDQYFVLESIHHNDCHDPELNEEPHRLLNAKKSTPCYGTDDRKKRLSVCSEDHTFSRMAVSLFRRGGVCEVLRIPEWLLLAGGPYSPSKSQTSVGRKALRDRLRDACDMLTWLIHGGVGLHPLDSWETTLEGFQQLLEVDVRPHKWDAYEEGERVVAMHHSYVNDSHQPPPGDRPIRLQYSVDALVAAMLSHFFRLGVFEQWPGDVMAKAMREATNFGKRENGAFRHTRTYKMLQRVAHFSSTEDERWNDLSQASRALAALLSDEERAGVLKYYHVRDAKMALASQLLKHLVVARGAGSDGPVPWRQTVISRDVHGKPVYYKEGSGSAPGSAQPVVFNVSHQNGLVVLAAVYGGHVGSSVDSSAFEVGVDVVSPRERRTRDHEMIAQEARRAGAGPASGWLHFVDVHADVLSPREVRYLKTLAGTEDDERLRLFYGLWCLREAYVKMTGEALLAEWLAELEFRALRVPGTPSSLWYFAAIDEDDTLQQGEMVTQHDIRFRGASVGDSVNMCLRTVGTGYMVCTAVRAAPGHRAVVENRAHALALPTTDAIELLHIDDILDFAERSGTANGVS
ncbi:hypothetical protein SEPCBS57363_002317 [Sporothrix epigloea]|uniref:holo-[acyl-carrier-protein] synthase n=1 Tax=Sporothrix epigloea TaxID=1892477 RepID=A0ABP0DF66_9PEZI